MRFSKSFLAVFAVLMGLLGVSPGFAQSPAEPVARRLRRRWTDEQLAEAVKKSESVNQVFKYLGLRVGGSQWEFVKRRIRELNLDASHFGREEPAPKLRAPATSRRGIRHWRWTPERDAQLVEAVKRAETYAEVVRAFGWRFGGDAYRRARARIAALGLDTSHFKGQGWNRGGPGFGVRPIPLQDVLIENSTYSTVRLKERLVTEGLLENRCAICELAPEWRGRRLVMRLDHINGVRNDNRLANLRVVCPNCDSQLDTFAGRNQSTNRVRRGLAPLPDTPR